MTHSMSAKADDQLEKKPQATLQQSLLWSGFTSGHAPVNSCYILSISICLVMIIDVWRLPFLFIPVITFKWIKCIKTS